MDLNIIGIFDSWSHACCVDSMLNVCTMCVLPIKVTYVPDLVFEPSQCSVSLTYVVSSCCSVSLMCLVS